MEWNTYLVLKACIEKAICGEFSISVFDLMYETGLDYPRLKDILGKLVAQDELEVIDVKTYKFTGDVNRTLEERGEASSQEEEEDYEESMRRIREIIDKASARQEDNEDETEQEEEYDEELAEKRRQRIRELMQQEEAEADEADDGEEPEEEGEEDDGDVISDIVVPDGEIDEDELRYNALKIGIRNWSISVPIILHAFPFVGYARANKLIEWMKAEGYARPISGYNSSLCRVTVTLEELDRIFRKTNALITDRLLEKTSRKNAIQNLAAVLFRIAKKKQVEEVTGDKVPSSSLWNYKEFDDAVLERLERLIRSDLKMARRGAIKKAETYLEAVRDTRDGKMVQVYERLVYELKVVSDRAYNEIRNRMREGG